MNEDFLHYTWKYRLFDSKLLRTMDGEILEIIKPGEHNSDGGPDFLNARIKIGSTTWAGNVEIHLHASDWNRHNHHKDKAYDNIILHVVFHNDYRVLREDKEPVPTLELNELIPQQIFRKYKNMVNSRLWIPCQNQIKLTDPLILVSWIDRLLIERLERKAESMGQTLKLYKNNWEQAFYVHMAKNFGFNLNSQAFEMLANATPLSFLSKHKNSLLQIEAMLFGQAGLLIKSSQEKYSALLQQEYNMLKQKFNMAPISTHLWRFLRVHPSGFPTIRIAQFASLIHRSSHLFSRILEAKKISELEDLFDSECSEYWQTHYVFGKESPRRSKKLGKSAIDNIIINTIVPFLFIYGSNKKEEKYRERAVRFMEQTEGETNTIITKWKLLGLPVKSASNTQALIELKNNYCNSKHCLRCGIGNYLLRRK
jgi:hypothetical protein